MSEVHLEVWSDILCPWCYIGSRHLAEAVATWPHEVAITWRAFQLDPTLDVAGITNRERLVEKFGGAANYAAAVERVTERGLAVGIEFDHRAVRAANTLRAHQLVSLASDEGKADETVARLFSAQFEQGRNVADPATLGEVATSAGLADPDAAVAAILADSRLEAVRSDIDEAARLGIHGIPTYVADRAVGVSGAVAPEVLHQLLDRALAPTG